MPSSVQKQNHEPTTERAVHAFCRWVGTFVADGTTTVTADTLNIGAVSVHFVVDLKNVKPLPASGVPGAAGAAPSNFDGVLQASVDGVNWDNIGFKKEDDSDIAAGAFVLTADTIYHAIVNIASHPLSISYRYIRLTLNNDDAGDGTLLVPIYCMMK